MEINFSLQLTPNNYKSNNLPNSKLMALRKINWKPQKLSPYSLGQLTQIAARVENYVARVDSWIGINRALDLTPKQMLHLRHRWPVATH